MEEVKSKSRVLSEDAEAEAEAECFKINRKSKVASRLKSAISDKLRDFLSDYSDDVLAEYITVLVCNGKNQYQARDELDAFLADRTPEFVSWLWGSLLKYACQTDEDTGFSHLKDLVVTHSGNGDGQDDSRTERLGHFADLVTVHPDDHTLTQDEKIYYIPASACDSGPSNNMEFTQCSRHYQNKSSMYDHSCTRLSTVMPADREQHILCMERPQKTTNSKCNRLANEVLYLPKMESVFSTSEYLGLKHICTNNVSRTGHLPGSFGALSKSETGRTGPRPSRVSVWDRLGKPCDNSPGNCETANAYHVNLLNLDKKVVKKQTLLLPGLDSKPGRTKKVPRLENICGDNIPSKRKKMEHGMSINGEPHTANNIVRNSHFREISHGPATTTVLLVGDRNNDLQCKEVSQEFKKSIRASDVSKTSSNLVSEVLSVKKKLYQIELEMSKLRSRQVEMRKNVKLNSPLHSGALKHPEKNSESRTIFVTNVKSL